MFLRELNFYRTWWAVVVTLSPVCCLGMIINLQFVLQKVLTYSGFLIWVQLISIMATFINVTQIKNSSVTITLSSLAIVHCQSIESVGQCNILCS